MESTVDNTYVDDVGLRHVGEPGPMPRKEEEVARLFVEGNVDDELARPGYSPGTVIK